MQKIDKLLISLNKWIQKVQDDEDITKDLPDDLPGIDKIASYIEDYEKKMSKLLRTQRKYYLNALKGFIKKDESEEPPVDDTITLELLLMHFTQNLFAADDFLSELEAATREMLNLTMTDLTSMIMDSIDKDVAFNTFSQRTVDWIEDWSIDLGKLMQLNTHEAIEEVLREGLENGESIQEVELKLKDLPQFDRKRARRTAQTEILTANSASQYEAYLQSPAVTGKKWRHSGARKNNPRENHVALDGTVVDVEDEFEIPGSLEHCMFPRDPRLTAKERVHCHCVLSPAVDEEIFMMSAEEKEAIREEVMRELANS
ncbi:hypothetical protein CN354_20775 [Bacillus cereus]|nr:hypothetical protein CN354_20775 [Bacillus cereus]